MSNHSSEYRKTEVRYSVKKVFWLLYRVVNAEGETIQRGPKKWCESFAFLLNKAYEVGVNHGQAKVATKSMN